jgi:NAD-dependent dihydropyrimidine dehydrogenase PreA subunit
MKGLRYLHNVATLKLDVEACIGCGRCLEVCPHQVFYLMDKRPLIIDFNACMECGACARNCPTEAIQVDAGVGCAKGLINEWFRKQGFYKTKWRTALWK